MNNTECRHSPFMENRKQNTWLEVGREEGEAGVCGVDADACVCLSLRVYVLLSSGSSVIMSFG